MAGKLAIGMAMGMYYYERRLDIEKRVTQAPNILDPEDVYQVWLLYHNPTLQALGPNDFPADECSRAKE